MNEKSARGASRVVSNVLLVAVIPVLFFGLIDPLEGGLALLVATLIYVVAFWLRREKPSRSLWIPLAAALTIGAVVLAGAIILSASGPGNPLHVLLVTGNWIYRAVVIATLVGGVLTLVKAFRPSSGSSTTP